MAGVLGAAIGRGCASTVLSFAGCVVLTGLALGWFVSPWFLPLAAFAGLNMVQARFTGRCPAALGFKRPGLRTGCAFFGIAPAYARSGAVRRTSLAICRDIIARHGMTSVPF